MRLIIEGHKAIKRYGSIGHTKIQYSSLTLFAFQLWDS